jgi:hypothetical protein
VIYDGRKTNEVSKTTIVTAKKILTFSLARKEGAIINFPTKDPGKII